MSRERVTCAKLLRKRSCVWLDGPAHTRTQSYIAQSAAAALAGSTGAAPRSLPDRLMAAVEHKYRVIKRLEAGGMAEVFLGEAVSVQGFKKRVAIKRVLPHLAQNQSFIEMFLDEARLS